MLDTVASRHTSKEQRRRAKAANNKRATSAIDKAIGWRVRLARQDIHMSQSTLAAALGLTFQQIQKYERGMNRISAGRLQCIATVLGVSYDSLVTDAAGVSASKVTPDHLEFIAFNTDARRLIESARVLDASENPSVLRLLGQLAAAVAAVLSPDKDKP